jgi:hypothetical protein
MVSLYPSSACSSGTTLFLPLFNTLTYLSNIRIYDTASGLERLVRTLRDAYFGLANKEFAI